MHLTNPFDSKPTISIHKLIKWIINNTLNYHIHLNFSFFKHNVIIVLPKHPIIHQIEKTITVASIAIFLDFKILIASINLKTTRTFVKTGMTLSYRFNNRDESFTIFYTMLLTTIICYKSFFVAWESHLHYICGENPHRPNKIDHLGSGNKGPNLVRDKSIVLIMHSMTLFKVLSIP